MKEPVLVLAQVHTSYGNIMAVRGGSLTVKLGEMACLIGAYGAGKSTTLMLISGILKPQQGAIWFQGKSLEGVTAEKRVQMGI